MLVGHDYGLGPRGLRLRSTPETVQVRIHLGRATLLYLQTSGSTHNFISKEALDGTSRQLERHDNIKDYT
jgi:hypothetical protein